MTHLDVYKRQILGNQYRNLYHERRIFFLRQREEGDYSAYQQNSQKEIDNLPVCLLYTSRCV